MFGTGLLKGLGITLKHAIDTFADDRKQIPSRYQDSVKGGNGRRVIEQPITQEGLLTIQYPEERRLLPERFRYIPMLIWDTQANEDKCTACGICAKVCPPQCIWIVRDMDANGKPVARPAEFYIDATICMSCSFCVEFCPFDAIKMNHDFELAVYDRYPQLVYDKAELTVPVEYYAALWPVQWAAEEDAKRKKEAEDKAKAEAKVKTDAEKVAKAASAAAAAVKLATEGTSGAAVNTTTVADGGAVVASADRASDEAAAKKARLDELKRKAAETARKRKEGGGA